MQPTHPWLPSYKNCVVFLIIVILIFQIYIIFNLAIHNKDINIRSVKLPLTRNGGKKNDISYNRKNVKEYVARINNAHIMDESGMYMIVPNLMVPADPSSIGNFTGITVCVHCTRNHLHHLVDLSVQWDGPISVSVLTYRQDAVKTLETILYLHRCFEKVRKYARFHLTFPIDRPPDILKSALKVRKTCDDKLLFEYSESKNYHDTRIPYPNNFLRNVAIAYSTSPFIFVIDIDFVPSKHLNVQFQKYLHRHEKSLIHSNSSKTALIIPSFESASSNISSWTKHDLIGEWDTGRVRPFYFEACHKCQRVTDYDRWRQLQQVHFLEAGYQVEWEDPWEPFYIARKNDLPMYDGRFKQYGFNRISQVCEMHVAGYQFVVMNNAFIVHRGFKQKGHFHDEKQEENEKNKEKFREFKLQLKERYPTSKLEC